MIVFLEGEKMPERDKGTIKCCGCGKKYIETHEHRHGSFCGHCSEKCFKNKKTS
jgi:hypothetical protein